MCNSYITQPQLTTRWCSKNTESVQCSQHPSRYFYPNISWWLWPLESREVITERVSPPVFEIISPWHDLNFSRSRDVIDHVTIQFAICHFLWVLHWNRVSIFNRFRDILAFSISAVSRPQLHVLLFWSEVLCAVWPVIFMSSIYRSRNLKWHIEPGVER